MKNLLKKQAQLGIKSCFLTTLSRYGNIYNYISFVKHIPEPYQDNVIWNKLGYQMQVEFRAYGNLDKA